MVWLRLGAVQEYVVHVARHKHPITLVTLSVTNTCGYNPQ